MGIYPKEEWVKGSVVHKDGTQTETVTNYYNGMDGVTRIRVFEKVAEIEVRTNCYCCSCGERGGSDPACRNHGWAAERPCEAHEMPGTPWGDELPDQEGQMPDSVQVERARLAALEEAYHAGL